MYKPGQLVVYSGEGVCRIEAVGVPELTGMKTECDYYTLRPVGRNITIYIPVNSNAYMRPVMTKTEANAFIRQMPNIDLLPAQNAGAFLHRDRYAAAMQSHSSTDLVRILKTIYRKQHTAETPNRQPGRIDEEYRKRAEDILYTEFSVALGIPLEEVPSYLTHAIAENGQMQAE